MQPHVVILESRRFPDITEQWYNIAVGALTQQGITFSRVTVPHAIDLPLAYQMLIEAVTTQNNTALRVPDGYLVLGLNYQDDTLEKTHHIIWEQLLKIAIQANVPFASVLEFMHNGESLSIAATKYSGKIQLAVQSIANLMLLRHQLYHPPFSKAA